MDQQVHAEPRRRLVAKRDHLAELPGGVDMQQRKRRLARRKSLLREMQHHARILADGIEHHRIFELGDRLADDVDRLRLEAAQADIMVTPVHLFNPAFNCKLRND